MDSCPTKQSWGSDLLLPLRVASFSLSQARIMVSSTYEGSTPKPSAHSQHQELSHQLWWLLQGSSSQQQCSSLRTKGFPPYLQGKLGL